MSEAEKHNVLPIDDSFLERTHGALVGRPDLFQGRTSLTLAEGMNVKNRSVTLTAEVESPAVARPTAPSSLREVALAAGHSTSEKESRATLTKTLA